MLAPILPRPIIPSCIVSFLSWILLSTAGHCQEWRRGTGLLLEDVHELPVAPHNFVDRVFPRDFLGQPIHQRIPEAGASHGESNEAGNAGRGGQPFAYFMIVLAAAQNDATDFIAPAPARHAHDFLAVLP